MSAARIAKEAWTVDDSIHARIRRVNEGEAVIAELTGASDVVDRRARLIAAAPKLLESLEELVEEFVSVYAENCGPDADPEDHPYVKFAREVITKAGGEPV